jgi:ABC transporter DrrB family efflux protein
VNGFLAILLKEFAHIRRDRGTLIFAFCIPIFQLTVFGFAIDLTIENIRTVVLDLDGRSESRAIVQAFENTRTFRVVGHVENERQLDAALAAGKAKVGIRIPPDFSDRLLRGEPATVQVLIDGSDSNVAMTALNTSKLLAFAQSLGRSKVKAESAKFAVARDPAGRLAIPIDIRPRLLFNPNLESEYFFVPALVGIIMQLVTLFLTAFALVKEREHGTLEQLFVTPVGRGGLMFGKLLPYALLGFGATLLVLTVMVLLFRVPIRGSIPLLLALSTLFLFTSLGLGLLVSTVARTQVQAMQLAFVVMLPSILLSGFMFPRETMPLPLYWLTFAIPVTYFLEILRGIVLRSAGFSELWPHVAGLATCCVVVVGLSVARFRKQLD